LSWFLLLIFRFTKEFTSHHRIVVSAIIYAEMRFAATGAKASPHHIELVDAFCARLDVIQPWDRAAVDVTTEIKVAPRWNADRPR